MPDLMTFEAAVAALSTPESPFAMGEAQVLGATQRVFTAAPPNLRYAYAAARAHGDRTYLVYEGERWSFAHTMAQADALAATMVDHYGITKGQRVAVAMRNFPEWIVSFIAITSIGAINVSLNSWWTADELAFGLEDCGASLLIGDDPRIANSLATCQRLGIKVLAVRSTEMLDGVDLWQNVVHEGTALPTVDIAPDDDATILYTSGTTGRPKGAVSTHRAIISALLGFGMRATVEGLRYPSAVTEPATPPSPPTFILIVPLFHVTGCIPVMLGSMIGGSKLVIMYKWDAEKALELIQNEQVNNFVGVPTQSWDLVHSPRFGDFDTSSLRGVGGGGAPAPASQVDLVAKSVPGGSPNIGYGMTETNAYGPQNTGPDYVNHPTSTGRPMPIMQIDVRDEDMKSVATGARGEIWFKGPMLIRGYWNRPDATADTIVDGWLRSGDVGRIDAEGYVYVEDRLKDMILRAGENVYCAEVEAAIYEHPGVHEAAVYGVPHERLGEEVAATVVVQPGVTLSAEELRAFLVPKLAGFKIPSHIAITENLLPRNAAGKFLKRELREAAAATLG